MSALDEWRGGSVDATIGADYRLRLPFAPGCARFYVLRPSTGSLNVTVPDARKLQVGGEPVYVVANHGSNTFTLRDAAAGSLGTVAVGACAHLILLDNSTAAGVWAVKSLSSTLGTALDATRKQFVLDLTSGTRLNLNLRTEIQNLYGYDGVTPVAIRCTIRPGVVIGSSSTSYPAFDSGSWPTGSTLLLGLGGATTRVCGRGGNGGRGGTSSLLPTAGSTGGPAMVLRIDTNLVNYGRIQGGGGGGGGGSNTGSGGGGGGGGGAGHQQSTGGIGSPLITGNGGQGQIDLGGPGGVGLGTNGGDGGGPGAAGSASGAAGGAAGNSILKLTGITLTKIAAGTIDGAEAFF